MKRFIAAVLTVITAIVCCSITVYAADKLTSPAVWYKAVNHDKVTLKWDKVTGAEKYYIYFNNSAAGKSKKIAATTKTSYTLKDLDAYTEYTYSVKAVGKNGSSKPGTITFTTPELWYYEVGNDTFTDKENEKHHNVYRQHYDGSGREKFDVYAVIDAAETKEDFPEYCYSYDVIAVEQHFGYVYFRARYMDICDAEEYDFYRMKNDGSEPVAFSGVITGSGYTYESLFPDPDNMYIFRDSYVSNGEFIDVACAAVSVTTNTGNNKFKINNIFSEEKTCVSKPVIDGENIYWFASPYRSYINSDLLKYTDDGDLHTQNSSTDAFLYKAKIGDKNCERVSKFRFKTSYAEDSITPAGIYNGYIYYSQQEGSVGDGRSYFGFYKLSIKDKSAKSVKLFRTRSVAVEAFIYDGKLIIAENESFIKKSDKNSCNIYTYDLNAKKPAVKTLKHLNTFSRHFEGGTLFEDFRIIGGKIFFKSYKTKSDASDSKSPIYYSIKLDGGKTLKSNKPVHLTLLYQKEKNNNDTYL